MLSNDEIKTMTQSLVAAVQESSKPGEEHQTALAVAGLTLLGNLLVNLNDVAYHLAEIAKNTALR